jgi:hypothetical protein
MLLTIRSYKMNRKNIFIVSQIFIIISYFFNILKSGSDEDALPVMGYQALFLNQYFIIGNILMALILLTAIGMVLIFIQGLIQHSDGKKYDQRMTILSNIQLFSGMIYATFLGTFLAFAGYILITLIIISAYTNYVTNK